MKRYRVMIFDFDSRAHILSDEIREEWEDSIQETHRRNREIIIQRLIYEYGEYEAELKIQNFIDLGPKPLSILAFHNRFSHQLRNSFIVGAYYPALTAACALGERILNHLILLLREEFRHTPEYRNVYRRDSFDNWNIAIATLTAWRILLPDVEQAFRHLATVRNRTLHFDPATEQNDRQLALDAIGLLNTIIGRQFGAFGNQPWFISDIPGEMFLRRQVENDPFIRAVYIPNCHLVGPRHSLEFVGERCVVHDDHVYEEREISDEEFRELRIQRA